MTIIILSSVWLESWLSKTLSLWKQKPRGISWDEPCLQSQKRQHWWQSADVHWALSPQKYRCARQTCTRIYAFQGHWLSTTGSSDFTSSIWGIFTVQVSIVRVILLRSKWSQRGEHDSQRYSKSVKKMRKILGLQMNACLKQDPSDWIFILKPPCQPGRISRFASWQFPLVDLMVPLTDSFTGLSWQSLSLRKALEKWRFGEREIKKSREEVRGAGLMYKKQKESLEYSWSFLRRVLTTHAAVWLRCQPVSSAAWCFGLWRKRLICSSFLSGSVQFGSVLHTAPQQTWSGESRWQSQRWLDKT